MTRILIAACVMLSIVLPLEAQSTGGGAAQPPVPEQVAMTPEQIVEAARQRRAAGMPTEAMELLRNLLKAIPTHTEANLLAGDILLENNDYDGARGHYKQVLDAEPSNFRANLGFGKIYLTNRAVRQATAYLEQAEAVAPVASRGEVKQLLAVAYMQMGKIQQSLDKAQEAVQADPDNLDSLQTLIQLRQSVATRDPRQVELAVADADKLVQKATQAAVAKPWNRDALTKLSDAYQMKLAVLQAYHGAFYQRDRRGQPIDELLPGRGPEAAATLMRAMETRRQAALLGLILSEHDGLLMAERAVAEGYDPRNVEYLGKLLESYQQVQELTARLLGPGVYQDTGLQERAIAVAQKMLDVDADNAAAREFLEAAGVNPGSAPPVKVGGEQQ